MAVGFKQLTSTLLKFFCNWDLTIEIILFSSYKCIYYYLLLTFNISFYLHPFLFNIYVRNVSFYNTLEKVVFSTVLLDFTAFKITHLGNRIVTVPPDEDVSVGISGQQVSYNQSYLCRYSCERQPDVLFPFVRLAVGGQKTDPYCTSLCDKIASRVIQCLHLKASYGALSQVINTVFLCVFRTTSTPLFLGDMLFF